MDRCGGTLACAHGGDDGGRTGNGVAACKNALARCLACFLVDEEATAAVGLDALGCLANQGIRGRADRDD